MRTSAARFDGGGRRRWPRFFLDLDWFVESNGCSAMGRGLELAVRGARLPVTCRSPFTDDIVLHVALPSRERLFRARCAAVPQRVAPSRRRSVGHVISGT
jgi:hypothetical protein